MSSRPTAVSLFSGLGGLDIGAHLAGVETLVCVDDDADAARTLRMNSQSHDDSQILGQPKFDWRVIQQDIRRLDADAIQAEFPSEYKSGPATDPQVDLVIGGPPCQSFSRSNEGSRAGADSELGRLYERYETILAELNPAGFVFENVVGILSSNKGDDIDAIRAALQTPTDESGAPTKSPYELITLKLDATDFGVPQSRERVFILGVRKDLGSPPSPERVMQANHPKGWSTAGEALAPFNIDADIEPYRNAIRSKYAGFLHRIPQGANYQHFSDRRYEDGEYIDRSQEKMPEKEWDWRSRHWNYLLKLDPNRPSWTLQAQPGSTVGPFHWRSRALSFIEQLRLMTIPVWYEVAGDPTAIQRQIGNAVPPYLGCAVVGALGDAIGLNRQEQRLTHPTSMRIHPTADQEGTTTLTISDSPWNHVKTLLPALRRHNMVELYAERDAIPRLIDVLELLRYWTTNIHIDGLKLEEATRPDPSESRTYRADTPAPSRLTAQVSLAALETESGVQQGSGAPTMTD